MAVMKPVDEQRRALLSLSAFGVTAFAVLPRLSFGESTSRVAVDPSRLRAVPFDLSSVRLRLGPALEALQIAFSFQGVVST